MKIKCRMENCKSELEWPAGPFSPPKSYLCSKHTDEELGITSRPDKDIHFQTYMNDESLDGKYKESAEDTDGDIGENLLGLRGDSRDDGEGHIFDPPPKYWRTIIDPKVVEKLLKEKK